MSEQTMITSCQAKGEDFDDVVVNYEIERPEPDVNFAGGVVINQVVFEGRDILDAMTEREVNELSDSILCNLPGEDDGYGDWLYEQRRDYELEQKWTARSLLNDPDRRYK